MPRQEVRRYIDALSGGVVDENMTLEDVIQKLIDFQKRHEGEYKRIVLETVPDYNERDCGCFFDTLGFYGINDETDEEMERREKMEAAMSKYRGIK